MKKQPVRSLMLQGTVVALLLSSVAAADAPNPKLVGQLAALGKYCSHLEPQLAASGEKFVNELTHDVAPGVASTAAYHQGYDQMGDALAKLSRPKGLALCALGPSGWARQSGR